MKDKMMLYGVEMSARYTRKQKELFLAFITECCKRIGKEVSFESKHSAFRHIASIEMGNVDKANIIVCGAYDTPEKAYIEMKNYPFNMEANIKEQQASLIVKVVAAIVLSLVMFLIVRGFGNYQLYLKILAGIAIAVILYVIYKMTTGIANTVNFSRNSAAVATIMKLAEEIDNEKVAFVLLDQTVNSYEGLDLLKEKVGNKKKIIYLDNLSYGNRCVVAHRGSSDVTMLLKAGMEEKIYREPSNALRFFDDIIQISCGDVENKQFVVKHVGSDKDHDIDMKRLEMIYQTLKSYINKSISN